MDAFEQIISQLLTEDGYWTIVGYKADITQAQADRLRKSMPRPEIDIVAYKPLEKVIYLLEVKSFLDSIGVDEKPFEDLERNDKGRYKILTWRTYRDIVRTIVVDDFYAKGLIHSREVDVQFGLIAGNLFKASSEQSLKVNFANKGYDKWIVWGPETITKKIRNLARKGYENNAVTMISKLMNPDLKKQGRKERQKKRRGA